VQLDLWFFLIAGPAVAFAGISKGGFGSNASFAGATILALIVEPGIALGLMMPLLLLIDFVTLKPYWRRWRVRESTLLVIGGLPGVLLGAWFLSAVSADVLRVLIGAVAVIFVCWHLAQRAGLIPVAKAALPDWVGALAGLVAGFTSFISHGGGPAAAVYLLSQRMDKTEYQASTVLAFTWINVAKTMMYGVLGLLTLETFQANIALVPFALAGAWIGVKMHHLMPERAYFMLTYVLLTVTGTKLIWEGLT